MITKNVGTVAVKGKSGKVYNFTFHTFDSFDALAIALSRAFRY